MKWLLVAVLALGGCELASGGGGGRYSYEPLPEPNYRVSARRFSQTVDAYQYQPTQRSVTYPPGKTQYYVPPSAPAAPSNGRRFAPRDPGMGYGQ